jgi:hypothetical protein
MAGIKVTDLQELTTPDGVDLIYIVDVSDTTESPQGTSKKTKLNLVLDLVSAVQTVTGELVDNTDPFNPIVTRPYLNWVGKLSQTGTADPTAVVVFENTLGVTLTYDRDGTGTYSFVSPSSLFDQANTLVLVTAGTSTYNDCFVVITNITALRITFTNYGNGGGLQDVFTNMNFEIRVY